MSSNLHGRRNVECNVTSTRIMTMTDQTFDNLWCVGAWRRERQKGRESHLRGDECSCYTAIHWSGHINRLVEEKDHSVCLSLNSENGSSVVTEKYPQSRAFDSLSLTRLTYCVKRWSACETKSHTTNDDDENVECWHGGMFAVHLFLFFLFLSFCPCAHYCTQVQWNRTEISAGEATAMLTSRMSDIFLLINMTLKRLFVCLGMK